MVKYHFWAVNLPLWKQKKDTSRRVAARIEPTLCARCLRHIGLRTRSCRGIGHAGRCLNRAALAAFPFTDGEELGDAWHAIAGFGRVWTSNEVDALLLANPLLAFRCAASTEALFFGPTRELLRTRALAHPSVRALRNLRRFRCIVWAVAKLLILEREARERVNAPGGVGFLQAQASFQFNSSRP